jgi:hypothetical protein
MLSIFYAFFKDQRGHMLATNSKAIQFRFTIRAFIFISILSINLISQKARAEERPPEAKSNERFCLCQVGTEPAWQVPFFKSGCSIWFLKNSCTNFATASIAEHVDQIVPNDTKNLFIGYVGHWGSSYELRNYLNEQIIPLSKVRSIETITVDNTACYSMSPPEVIQTWLIQNRETFKDKQLSIKGNQTLSIGMQQPFFWGKGNFWASVDSESLEITYPNCKEFETNYCTADQFRGRAFGTCIDRASNKLKDLHCSSFLVESKPSGEDTSVRTVYRWAD